MSRRFRIHTYRYNPTASDTPWIVGGALAFAAVLALAASRRSAQAQPLPNATPAPMPRPTPTLPPADMTFTPEEVRAIGQPLVRQTNPTESTRSVRILQIQLQDLGYAITRTDGRQGEETNAAVARFIAANGLPAGAITPVELMRAVDAEYMRVFGERGYV